jgi:hypothetical protein
MGRTTGGAITTTMSFFADPQRRNVFRVGIPYTMVAWLIIQVADVVLDNIEAPGWVFEFIMLLLAIRLPRILQHSKSEE